MNQILLLSGGFVAAAWGVAHIIPTRGVVAGFGELSRDNRLIITMEWVAEGLALIFLGALVLILAATPLRFTPAALLVYRLAAGMLLLMAVWTRLTGGKTSIMPLKLCPLIKTACALAILLGSRGM